VPLRQKHFHSGGAEARRASERLPVARAVSIPGRQYRPRTGKATGAFREDTKRRQVLRGGAGKAWDRLVGRDKPDANSASDVRRYAAASNQRATAQRHARAGIRCRTHRHPRAFTSAHRPQPISSSGNGSYGSPRSAHRSSHTACRPDARSSFCLPSNRPRRCSRCLAANRNPSAG
jgi:hypothetical protein